MRRLVSLALLAMCITTPAHAGWTLIEAQRPVAVARDTMTVTPGVEWNRTSSHPGKRAETWTRDGLALNEVNFIGAVRPGEPLFRERSKKHEPLPKFAKGMLPADIPDLFESTVRILTGSAMVAVDDVRPATLSGHNGVEVGFRYTAGDELERTGLARAAIVGDTLYLIQFNAPTIHYFADGIDDARVLMDTAKIGVAAKK